MRPFRILIESDNEQNRFDLQGDPKLKDVAAVLRFLADRFDEVEEAPVSNDVKRGETQN